MTDRMVVTLLVISIYVLGPRADSARGAGEPALEPGTGSEVTSLKHYVRLGASLGTPAGVNGVFEVEAPLTTLSVSGMRGLQLSGEFAEGIQAGISLLRYKRETNYLAINVVAGSSRLGIDSWRYWGGEAVATLDWLFIKPGVTAGSSGKYRSPQFIFQCGLMCPF